MIQHLSVRNYALIQSLDLDFKTGLTAITGETGSGKSILIGALGILLGNRANHTALNKEKCIVEGHFQIPISLRPFFEARDLDFAAETIIRREITASGKSRAFVNDTPVKLDQLAELGAQLVDIHSQHENKVIRDQGFRLSLLDIIGDTSSTLKKYKASFRVYEALKKELKTLKNSASTPANDLDYLRFQLKELEASRLETIDQAELESENNLLSNSDAVRQSLSTALGALDHNETNILGELRSALHQIKSVENISTELTEMCARLESVRIELTDIHREIENYAEGVADNPVRLAEVQNKLNNLYALQQKHRVVDVEGLIKVRHDVEAQIEEQDNREAKIENLQEEVEIARNQCLNLASELSDQRGKAGPILSERVVEILTQVGMQHALFAVEISQNSELNKNGIDAIRFLFSANPGGAAVEVEKVASGGEFSRLMLALKACFSKLTHLPTLILDEIDTGVSGEIARKVGRVMKSTAHDLQLITITHLPQIASLADHHFKVLKEIEGQGTNTQITLLQGEDRVQELAGMLSGEVTGGAALENARELLETD